jgi:hypothetical protein
LAAAPFERHLRLADDVRGEGRDLRGDRIDDERLDDRVGRHGVRIAAARDADGAAHLLVDRDDVAVLVEADYELPDVLVVAGRRDHRDRRPVRPGGRERIRQRRVAHVPGNEEVVLVREQLVSAARDRDVEPAQLRDQREILVDVLEVADQDDLVHLPGRERVDLPLDRADHVGVGGHVPRARDRRQERRRRSDDADQLAALLDDHRLRDPSFVDQALERGLAREVEVGAQERHRRREAVDEVGEHFRPEVELVVPDRHRVVPDQVEADRVVERHSLREARIELRAGEEVVAGRQHHRPRLAGPLLGRARARDALQPVDLALEPRDAPEVRLPGRVDQARLPVVVVQHGQPELNPWLVRGLRRRYRLGGFRWLCARWRRSPERGRCEGGAERDREDRK